MNHQKNHNNRKESRQSNIELLRIVAMLMIIAHHFAVHSGFNFLGRITLNHLWIEFISIGGKIGVDIFVLISGYFLVRSQSFKTSRLLRLWTQVSFYSVVIYALFVMTGQVTFSLKSVVKAFLPITFNSWWFASTYFILYLLSPFINKMLNAFDKKWYLNYICLILTMWCILPTFIQQSYLTNQLIWFVVLYSLGGYIRLQYNKTEMAASKLLGLAALFIVLTFIVSGAFSVLGTKLELMNRYSKNMYAADGIPIVVISVLLLIGFLKLDIGYSKLINTVSSAAFGVYLLHDNNYVRPFLWKTLFKNTAFTESKVLIPYSLVVIAVVFVGCIIIELGRINLIEKRSFPIINKVSYKIDGIFEKIISYLMTLV